MNLEARFRRLSTLLYDTSVPPAQLDAEVLPFLADDVRFTDPWQEEQGLVRYRLGAAGFHTMFSFTLDITQVSVQRQPGGGRAIVDGVMQLTPVRWLPAFPLRTILVFGFTLEGETPLIHTHEEMWSVADLIAATPALGPVYRKLFRPAFAQAFLAASRVACRLRGTLPD